MNPNHLKVLQKAQSLNRSGKVLDASRAFRDFLGLEPKHADAWADYAGTLVLLDRLDQAQQACDTALDLDPHQPSARTSRGFLLMREGRLDESEGQLRSVLDANPDRMDARLLLAQVLLHKQGLENVRVVLDGAVTGTDTALKAHQAELWAILSSALFERQDYHQAEAACDRALQVDSDNLMARSNKGSIRMVQGDLGGAADTFRRLLAEHPRETAARLLLITCLARMGEMALVDQEIARVLHQAPSSLSVHKELVATFYNHGRWNAYRSELERFRKVDPASAHPEWEQSLVDLLFGDLPKGWEGYEARLRLPLESKPRRTFAQPAWQGEPFTGKTLLLWAEQGFGDTLLCLRYLPLVKALGGRVILGVQPALMDVAATCEGVDLVIPWRASWPGFDLQASLMSLPWIFRTDLSSIPAEIPYLDVPEKVPHRQELLEHLNLARDTTRIGLVWAVGPGHPRGFERSLSTADLAPLAALPGVTWFSFQLDMPELPPLPNLVPLAPLLETFSDTAYALSGMDLVISVDTALPHLAGALGIPTLLLLSFQPDFRWLLDRDDSPWFPSLRLYRQPAYGDWASVLQRVVANLTLGP